MSVLFEFPMMIIGKYKMSDKNEFVGYSSYITPKKGIPWVLLKINESKTEKEYRKELVLKSVETIKKRFPDRGIFVVFNYDAKMIEFYKSVGFLPWRSIRDPMAVQPITQEMMVHSTSLGKAWHTPKNQGINSLDRIYELVNY